MLIVVVIFLNVNIQYFKECEHYTVMFLHQVSSILIFLDAER